MTLCNKCKEGYYSIDGICHTCSSGSEKCVKCSYVANGDKNEYTCHECVDGLNGEYRVNKFDGKCRTCDEPPCSECHYKVGTEYDYICTKCMDGYYLSNDRCHECYDIDNKIPSGKCKKSYCPGTSNHDKISKCKCNDGYALAYQTCISCPSNFQNCHYDSYTDKTKCSKCDIRHAITAQGECISCPIYCYSCYYDENTKSAKCKNCYDYYVITDQGTCMSCPDKCNSCYYDSNTQSAKCNKCYNRYVITDQGTCMSCPVNCNSCYYDSNTQSAKCNDCDFHYALTDQGTCIACPGSPCSSCYYDTNANSIKCNNCLSNYVLNSNNVCVNCGVGCNFCKFQDEKIICINCYEDYLWDGNICQKMYVPQYCTNHKKERFSNKNEFVCTSCDYKFALDIKNNKCIHCPNYCTSCHLDDSNRFICDNCDLNYVLNETKLCEFCTSNEEIGGEGCLQCKYENGINKCTDCRNDYIHIDNDYVCKLPSEVNLHIGCKNATSLKNGEYTCKICRNISYTMITKYNNIKDCYPSENELVNCEYETEDEDKNLTCTNCLYRYRFIWSEKYQTNKCDNQCASDYFFNNNYNIRGCFKCDDESGGGQISYNPKKECSYRAVDNHLYCNSCKTGYFKYNWQSLTCSKKDINCIECDFNNEEKNLNVINV